MNGLAVKEVEQIPKLEGGHIFNTPTFQALKKGNSRYFVLFKDNQAVARICFFIGNGTAISGYQATFGSIDSERPLGIDALSYFLKQTCQILNYEGFEQIIIKHWPTSHTQDNRMHEIFIKLGFQVLNSEVNQHRLVTEEDFQQKIKTGERGKISQSKNKGYVFKILTIHELSNVYNLIQETLTRRDNSVSMSYEELSRAIEMLPEGYLLFGLYDGEKLIAATVSLRISKEILYNFYHADDFAYRTTSPLVMLIQEIYKFCQHEKIKILDLGISSEQGIINQGLFNFKRNLGCESSEKNTYRWCNE